MEKLIIAEVFPYRLLKELNLSQNVCHLFEKNNK